MKKRKNNHKKYKFTYIKYTLLTLFVCLLFVKGYVPFEHDGENFFSVQLNGQDVGTLGDRDSAERLLMEARRNLASKSEELIFMEAELTIQGKEVLWGDVDSEKSVRSRMEAVLRKGVQHTLHRSYTVKINDFIINLANLDEVLQLLQAGVDKYDAEGKFQVELAYDAQREFNVLTASVGEAGQQEKKEEKDYSRGGIANVLWNIRSQEETRPTSGFEQYDLGIMTMGFAEEIEIVEGYIPSNRLTPLDEAIELVIKEQETPSIYEVVEGDTLTEIALKVNIPMDKIVEMNSSLSDVNATLSIGQQLVITVPEPELSVTRVENNYYEEVYDAEVIIIDVNDWYTTKTEVIQQPSAGFRKVVASVTYVNDKEVSREILEEEVVAEAVPKIMKRGTKIPPTFIKPISGGRLSSNYGNRNAPRKGASTNHKGVDWATPTGTAVYASCGGTVSKAGWGSGYGYVVYIDHEGGLQTRYAHLSRVLVSVGKKVKQGDRIALSGNTGNSTGPHLHFEIRQNGRAVNPFNYVSR